MTEQEKKISAAMAAVAAYMQQEQEAYVEALTAASAPAPCARFEPNLWGMSGRQNMMNLRSLMQLKAFDRFR